MKRRSNPGLRLVMALVVVIGGGWMLGGVLNTAALVSPQLVSKIECPPGSTAKEGMSQQSFDQPGQKTLTFECQDQAGKLVPPLSDAQTKALEYRYFFPAGVVLMMLGVVGWEARSAMRGRTEARTESPKT